MQAIQTNSLFTEVSAEESAIVSGGSSITAEENTVQQIFALGASEYTLLLTGNKALAASVLDKQFNRSFDSIIGF